MTIVLLMLAGAVVALALFSPRWGFYSFWFLTMMYPQSALSGLLPLRIRLDDALLVLVTLLCLRQNRPGALSTRSVKMATLWFVAMLMGNFMGLLTGPTFMITAIVRALGKAAYVPMIVIIMNSIVDSDAEMRRLIKVILLASLGSFAIAILQVSRPDLTAIWETPVEDVLRRTVSETSDLVEDTDRRAGGALTVVTLAIVSAIVGVFALRLMVHSTNMKARLFNGLAAGVAVMTLGYTITRGAIAGFAAAVLYGIVFHGKRALMIVVVSGGALFLLVKTDIGDRIMARVLGKSQSLGELSDSADLREALWQIYFRQPSVHYLLFGRGMTAEIVRHAGSSAHSSYIGAIAYTGVFGVIIMAWIAISSWRFGNRLRKLSYDPLAPPLGEGLMLALIAILINGVSAEVWQANSFMFFAVLALADIRLTWHEQYAASAPAPAYIPPASIPGYPPAIAVT